MELQKKISIDVLNKNSVTIKTQRYIVEDGQELDVGEVHAKAYVNSENGRKELSAEVDEPYLSGVLAVWGDVPIINEKENDEV